MEYELVHEILNHCPNNQMRDVFIEEVETNDPEALVRALAARTDFWGEDLNALPGLTERAAYWLDVIRNEGMRSAVARAAEEIK